MNMRRISFILTNRCNLRCVYCPQGSHPESYHADLEEAFFEEIRAFAVDHKVEEMNIGYYGEITMIPGWWKPVQKLLDGGFRLSATTNGALPLSPEEVATFARFTYIEWSIDTHDVAILKKVRKKVDARTIIHNFHLVRSHCLLHDLPLPELAWTGVLTFDMVHTLPEFVAYASSCNVQKLNFNEVGVYEGAPARGLNIIDQPQEKFDKAAAYVDQAIALAGRLGIKISVQELTRINERRKADYQPKPLVKASTPVADIWIHSDGNALVPGQTRDCRSPWEEIYLDPKGQVFSCCIRGEVMGTAKTKADLETILSGEKYEQLRAALKTGTGLDDSCKNCPITQAIPVVDETPVIEPPAPSFWRRLLKKAA